jgi:flavin reductase (DIM6/NTAB) family NADH-FMN oxidoreductase RutF
MAAVYHHSHTHQFIQKSGAFAVNLLAADQSEIARHFGRQTGRDVDKFKREDIYWERRITRSPILIDALAYFDCRVVDAYDPPGGDHTLYIGEVIDAEQLREAEPLIFRRSDYPYRVMQVLE